MKGHWIISSWLKSNFWRILGWFVAGTCVLLLSLCGLIYYAINNDPFNDWWFEEKTWKSQYNSMMSMCESQRYKMASDLQQRVLKKSMTKQQVTDLLGQPEAQREARSRDTLNYYIGCDWDPQIFEVKFDKRQRLISSSWFYVNTR